MNAAKKSDSTVIRRLPERRLTLVTNGEPPAKQDRVAQRPSRNCTARDIHFSPSSHITRAGSAPMSIISGSSWWTE